MNANNQPAILGKILLIDDEAAILITLKKILRVAGFEAQTASSGPEGLELFQQTAFDLVIVDRKMPEMDGEAVAAEIKRRTPGMPIILITGFPGAVTRRELFYAVIGKPFRPPELIQAATAAISRAKDESQRGVQAEEKRPEAVPAGSGYVGGTDSAGIPRPWNMIMSSPCVGSA